VLLRRLRSTDGDEADDRIEALAVVLKSRNAGRILGEGVPSAGVRIASDLLPQIRTQRSMISYFGGREEHARGKLSEAEMIAALKQV
jgi:hypothetical protein